MAGLALIRHPWKKILSLKRGSHQVVWVVRVVQKDPKDKDSEFESFVVWVALHDLDDPNDLV